MTNRFTHNDDPSPEWDGELSARPASPAFTWALAEPLRSIAKERFQAFPIVWLSEVAAEQWTHATLVHAFTASCTALGQLRKEWMRLLPAILHANVEIRADGAGRHQFCIAPLGMTGFR